MAVDRGRPIAPCMPLTTKAPTLPQPRRRRLSTACLSCIASRSRTRKLVANPGCYATSVILALKPLVAAGLVDLEHGIVADAKSGVSGAGKVPTARTHFMYAADNLSAYGVFTHRHTGEILEEVGVSGCQIVFTPHLLPIPRGILSTIYVHFAKAANT